MAEHTDLWCGMGLQRRVYVAAPQFLKDTLHPEEDVKQARTVGARLTNFKLISTNY